MIHQIDRAALALGVALTLCPLPSAAQADHTLTAAERAYGLSRIWSEATFSFAFFDQVPELDWDSAYQAFLPRVLEAESTVDYYRLLQRFTALLEDGHTGVSMPRWFYQEGAESYPWVRTEAVGHRAVVRNVGRSLADQLPVGSEIVAVDGRALEAYLRTEQFPYIGSGTEHVKWDWGIWRMLQGPPDTPVRLTWITPDGERREETLRRDRLSREDAWAVEPEPRPEPFALRWLDDGIGYVQLNTFGDTAVAGAFEAALPELVEARALILDLRNNGGGSSGVGYRIAEHLTDRGLETSRWRTPEHRAAHRVWGQYGEEHRAYAELDAWYDGGVHDTIAPAAVRLMVPTVVLQGHATASAAEDFLVAVDPIPHLVTVGELTFGSTGQPYSFPLPGGGRARICTKRDSYPDGREFVGYGIEPDVAVSPAIEDVRAGRDPALEQAVSLLRERLAFH